MTFEGAEIREQNVSFAIVVVKPNVLNYTSRPRNWLVDFKRYSSGRPVVLNGLISKVA
ncbi:MAG: hypothetical protein U0931_41250 [Vulcanimicrobiota bacterium]